MKGDFTRWTFTPAKSYTSVLLQQGRVLLDADWNEQREIDLAARRRLAADLIGPAAGPLGDVGYGVTEVPGGLTLAQGRYYVEGVLCELHADTSIPDQPDLPGVDPLEERPAGRYLVYLDVWERHVTHIEDGDIKEKALGGPDHTTRAQVVAQARLLDLDALGLGAEECDSLHDPLVLASLVEGIRGKMAASVDPAPPAAGPCVVPASAGYRGLENQLYRVEIHKSGADDTVTFKWSRDNGSVVTAWTGHPDPAGEPGLIEVADLGPDSERTFNQANVLVELLDDTQQLLPGPGLLARVESGDEAARTLTLKDPMDENGDPHAAGLSAIERGDAEDHPRVRRWEGLAHIDDEWITLEEGVRVRFEVAAGEVFRSGDFWLVPARTVDGTIAWDPDAAQLPHGITHRYACLAVVETDGAGNWTVEDTCQRAFPSADALTHLRYVGGDGQQAVLSDPAHTLPSFLRVAVLNGGVPVHGALVRFRILAPVADGSLTDLESGATGPVVDAVTTPDGIARVRWTLASETAWDSDSDLVDQRVRATLLDECGDETHQLVLFSVHEPQAHEVRHDNTACPPMAQIEAAGFETDSVASALDVLCANPHLSYVSGDGQEAMPGDELDNDLVVRVGNGAWPWAGVTVQFTLLDLADPSSIPSAASDEAWAGSLDDVVAGSVISADWPSGSHRQISVLTDSQGYARVRWRLGDSPGAQRPGARAQIILPSGPIPFATFAPGASVYFQGSWSLAEDVAYVPACEHLSEAGVSTVQEALDALCTDRTLYYVAGTGQATELGETLPVPLAVRVANEGVPMEGALVRFFIRSLDGSAGLTEATGGTLDPGGPGVVSSTAWMGSPGIREVRVSTDASGQAAVTWTYPAVEGERVPGVQAILLDTDLTGTTSEIRFGAVLMQPGVVEDEGIHVTGTTMVDRSSTTRALLNDTVVDPSHLLDAIRIECDGAVDPAALEHKRTAHLRVQVPYGWPPFATPGKDPDPYFAAEGVQHYDEHVLAGKVTVDGDAIVWTPTTAARRMLVHPGIGPMTTWSPYFLLLPQDWPLPLRLFLFGGGETRVRATLTVEGDFVTAQADSDLHVDGETLGAPGGSGTVDLAFPSGDGRAGGDFVTWFWLEGRVWSARPTEPGITTPSWTDDLSVVGHRPSASSQPTLTASWVSEERVRLAHWGGDSPTWTVPEVALGEGAAPQEPGLWQRIEDDGSTTTMVSWRNGDREARLARVQGTATVKEVDLTAAAGRTLPRAATAPRGLEQAQGSALSWVGTGGELVVMSEDGSGAWSAKDLATELLGSATRELTDKILALRASGGPSLAGPGQKALTELALGLGRGAGLNRTRRELLASRAMVLLGDQRPGLAREDVQRPLEEVLVKGGVVFKGQPVIARADGTLFVLAQATRARKRALYAFSRRGGSWTGREISTDLDGWRASPSDCLHGAAAAGTDGDPLVAAAWTIPASSSSSRKGRVLVLRKESRQADWQLEEVPVGGRTPRGTPQVVVDEQGIIHVFVQFGAAGMLDAWSDGPGVWTVTDVSERVGMSRRTTMTATLTADGGYVLLATAGEVGNSVVVDTAWFGPPLLDALPFGTDDDQAAASSGGTRRLYASHLTTLFRSG